MPPANHKAWESASHDNVAKQKDHGNKVAAMLKTLLAKEENEKQAKENERKRLEAEAERARQEQLRRERQAAAAAEKELARQLAIAEEKRQEEKRRAAAAAYAAQIAAVAEEKRVLAESEEMDLQHKAMNDAATKVGMAMLDLQYSIRTKYSALKSCECKLEMRDRRPLAENFSDCVQEALENERATVKSTRTELNVLEHEGKKLGAELRAVQNRLAKGGARREANIKKSEEKEVKKKIEVEEKAKLDAHFAAKLGLKKSLSLPSLVSVPAPAPASPAATNMANSPMTTKGVDGFNLSSPAKMGMSLKSTKTDFAPNETGQTLSMSAEERELMGAPVKQLFERSYLLVDKCFKFASRADEALLRTDTNCDAANGRMIAALDKRKLQNETIREKLVQQAEEADQIIGHCEEHIHRLKRPLIALQNVRFVAKGDARKLSAEETKAAEEKWAQLHATEAALEEMREHRKSVENDIRCKVKAMMIDDQAKILRATGIDIRSTEERDKHRLNSTTDLSATH